MRTSTYRIVAILGLGLFASTGCGHAAGPTGLAADPTFATLDTDGDGRLSPVESHLTTLAFHAMDRNGDGYIDVLEWMATGDNASVIAHVQQRHDEQRDEKDQHRNGSTTRGDR